MEIVVNKYYINAKGAIIFIVENYPYQHHPFMDKEHNRYLSNGKFLASNRLDSLDLICECVPDILAYYTANFITQKEFIQLHIDYYTNNKEGF